MGEVGGGGGELTLAGSWGVVLWAEVEAAWLSRAACWLATRRILPFDAVPLSLGSLSSCAFRDAFVGAIVVIGRNKLARARRQRREASKGKVGSKDVMVCADRSSSRGGRITKVWWWDRKLHCQGLSGAFLGSEGLGGEISSHGHSCGDQLEPGRRHRSLQAFERVSLSVTAVKPRLRSPTGHARARPVSGDMNGGQDLVNWAFSILSSFAMSER